MSRDPSEVRAPVRKMVLRGHSSQRPWGGPGPGAARRPPAVWMGLWVGVVGVGGQGDNYQMATCLSF